MGGEMEALAVGDRVVVLRHRTLDFVDEPGKILGFCGPADGRLAVVLVRGVAPLVPVEHLQREEE